MYLSGRASFRNWVNAIIMVFSLLAHRYLISWLTVSNQIVKSLSLSYRTFYFFNMVQPIDLIFCKMVQIIEQNIFNRADFLFRS